MLRKSLFVLMVLTSFSLVGCRKSGDPDKGKDDSGLATVGDYVWIDSNQNGIQDGDEKGLEYVDVLLEDFVINDNLSNQTTHTDENGHYIFRDVEPGDYRLTFSFRNLDYTFTFPNQGKEDNLDSDVTGWNKFPDSYQLNTGSTDYITVTKGENLHWDAGVVPVVDDYVTATPGGRVVLPAEETPDPEFEFFAPLVLSLCQEDFISQNVYLQLQQESESPSGCCNLVLNSPEDQEKEAFAHTDILNRIALSLESSPSAAERWFGMTDFPCGQGDYGYTVCGAGSFTAGRGVMVLVKYNDEIPLEDSTNYYQYGFVFDRDGDSANNYKASPAFPGDFFDDTDLWYELTYHPAQGWMLMTTDVLAGYAQITSGARAIISGDTIMLLIPEGELSPENLLYRVTAFRHTGDFGLGPPFDWDADIAPPVHEPLLEMSEVDVVVQ